MFLEMTDVEKYYGKGENRVQVLKGISVQHRRWQFYARNGIEE